MNIPRAISLTLLLIAFGSIGHATQKERTGPKITAQTFRGLSFRFLDDPLNKSSPDWARLILLYALDSSDVAIVLGREERSWVGLDDNNPRSLQLLAAYEIGNVQSQLNSGVKRSDRYSGMLTLFRVYRALQEKDDKFKVKAVEQLLALHQEGKLLQHLQKLEATQPAKLTPVEEQIIRNLMKTR